MESRYACGCGRECAVRSCEPVRGVGVALSWKEGVGMASSWRCNKREARDGREWLPVKV